jgi:hypothetical protein
MRDTEETLHFVSARAEGEDIGQRRKMWFEKADCKERTKRDWRYEQGRVAGYQQAAEDYAAGRVKDADLDALAEHEVTDFHAIGFEAGYLRKLAEIELF